MPPKVAHSRRNRITVDRTRGRATAFEILATTSAAAAGMVTTAAAAVSARNTATTRTPSAPVWTPPSATRHPSTQPCATASQNPIANSRIINRTATATIPITCVCNWDGGTGGIAADPATTLCFMTIANAPNPPSRTWAARAAALSKHKNHFRNELHAETMYTYLLNI